MNTNFNELKILIHEINSACRIGAFKFCTGKRGADQFFSVVKKVPEKIKKKMKVAYFVFVDPEEAHDSVDVL